jgi:hypothetical protein
MKALTITLALLLVGCILALAWVLGTPAPADSRVAKLEAELREARQTITQLKRDLAEKASLTSRAPASVPQAAPLDQLSSDPASMAAADKAQTAGNVRELLKNPAMRAMMDQQQAVMIETSYTPLFNQLQLTEEEKEHFKKLLVEKQKAETDLGLKLLDPNLSPAERQNILAQAEKNKQTFDQAIKTFLNDEGDWNSFQNWETTKPDRTLYDSIGRSLFAGSPEPLTPQQEQMLINTMTQMRTSPTPEQQALAKAMQDPTQMTEANIKRFLELTAVNHQRILDQAAQSMTPTQLATLKNFLSQVMKNAEISLKMSPMLGK